MINRHILKPRTTFDSQVSAVNKEYFKSRKLKTIFAVLICFFSVGITIAQETSPIAVPVLTARRGTIVSTTQYTGHLEPQAEVSVFANVSGKIVTLNATVGQSVAKGDVIAEINSSEATLAVIRAESTLSSAQSQLTLKEANAQADIESQLAVAEEKLMTAQAQLVETKSLAEMRVRNQLIQAESGHKAAQETIEKSKTNAEQALARAKVERDDAQADYYRNKSLHEKQLISDSNFESVEKRLKLAETRLEEAQVTAAQFVENSTHPSIEKAKAELGVAQKLVEIRSWERENRSGRIKGHTGTNRPGLGAETGGRKIVGTRDCDCEVSGASSRRTAQSCAGTDG